MSLQRYVSKELTHFVGGGLNKKILHQGSVGEVPASEGYEVVLSRSPERGSLSGNKRYDCLKTCFCDIPADDLSIHMQKYSRFGLAFSKQFLIGKGATPVFYISRESMVDVPFPVRGHGVPSVKASLKGTFDCYEAEWHTTTNKLQVLEKDLKLDAFREISAEVTWRVLRLYDLLFCYTKFFDGAKEEDDPENFYMEREWGVLDRVPFALSDVCRIILPESYARRFRADIPDYFGQISFV